jgi:bilirubin oxidase
MESPLNGADYDLLDIRVGSPLPGAITIVPDSLAQQNRLSVNGTETERLVVFSSSTPGSPVGPFLLNDSTFNMERIDFRIPVGSTEIWTIHNQTVVAHPFHLHGFSFYVLDRYGVLVDPEERGAKDMVQVAPNESLRIITRFSDFADSTMPYMFHCHILTHEDEGMMGQFVVTPIPTETKEDIRIEPKVGPNPFQNRLALSMPESEVRVKISNIQGQVFFEGKLTESGIETTSWPSGMYLVRFENGPIARAIRY